MHRGTRCRIRVPRLNIGGVYITALRSAHVAAWGTVVANPFFPFVRCATAQFSAASTSTELVVHCMDCNGWRSAFTNVVTSPTNAACRLNGCLYHSEDDSPRPSTYRCLAHNILVWLAHIRPVGSALAQARITTCKQPYYWPTSPPSFRLRPLHSLARELDSRQRA